MAHPFGGHPTLAQYILWAREEHGCESRTGTTHGQSFIRIEKDSDHVVFVFGDQINDYLSPTQVGNLDRRLSIESPWVSF